MLVKRGDEGNINRNGVEGKKDDGKWGNENEGEDEREVTEKMKREWSENERGKDEKEGEDDKGKEGM